MKEHNAEKSGISITLTFVPNMLFRDQSVQMEDIMAFRTSTDRDKLKLYKCEKSRHTITEVKEPCSVMEYWVQEEFTFRLMSEAALWLLAASVSMAASERDFSTLMRLVTYDCNRLSADMIDALMFGVSL